MVRLPMILQGDYQNKRVYFCNDASSGGLPYWSVSLHKATHFFDVDYAKAQYESGEHANNVISNVELVQMLFDPTPVAEFSMSDILQDAVETALNVVNDIISEIHSTTDANARLALLPELEKAQNAYRKALEVQANNIAAKVA